MEEKLICSHCGNEITDDDYSMVNGQIVCSDCVERYCCTCDRCGATIFDSDAYGDEYTNLCRYCYDNYYTRCENCDALVHVDDAYHYNNSDYCSECYHDIANENSAIKEYGYKPEPVFYGDNSRYFGVELEIDGAGKDSDNAREILDIGNEENEHIYIKSDGSLDDGIEIVSHPMTLDYHKNYCWSEIMKKAVSLGYRSHQTSTCGLHIHVNRICFGESREEQDETISKILYFVEHHWNELLKFSRRSEYAMNRWASRYGYENSARAILDKAKKGNNGRYAAVNLMNYSTIEFRMFRGTLKLNTFMATLELVNTIINVALDHSEDGLHKLSWSEFVSSITEPELIAYLKERRLYINEIEDTEEDV
ncbi:MAG: amidoligase family protein [Ruminococcus sp.]|nr:amidoligase family protein [Ruminococcus sp.]